MQEAVLPRAWRVLLRELHAPEPQVTTHAATTRTCQAPGCSALFATTHHKQKYCSVACRGQAQRDPVNVRAARSSKTAAAMVRGWTSAQRERIRQIELTLADGPDSPEMAVVALIDQEASQDG